MGLTDFFSDVMSSLFVQEVHAEAPKDDEKDDSKDEESDDDDKKDDKKDDGEDKKDDEGGDDEKEDKDGDDEKEGEDEDEEEEEEEDEPVDPKPKLEEDCAKSAQCRGYKHHFDECVERITAQHEDPDFKGPKEDCVEEFFHLQHCATQCAAPKLFKQLK